MTPVARSGYRPNGLDLFAPRFTTGVAAFRRRVLPSRRGSGIRPASRFFRLSVLTSGAFDRPDLPQRPTTATGAGFQRYKGGSTS